MLGQVAQGLLLLSPRMEIPQPPKTLIPGFDNPCGDKFFIISIRKFSCDNEHQSPLVLLLCTSEKSLVLSYLYASPLPLK